MNDDVQMTASARKILVSNWFDIAQIRVKIVRGVVTLQGHVEKMAGERVTMDHMIASLRRMDDGFRSMKGFRGAAYALDNWAREETGSWVFKGSRKEKEELLGK